VYLKRAWELLLFCVTVLSFFIRQTSQVPLSSHSSEGI